MTEESTNPTQEVEPTQAPDTDLPAADEGEGYTAADEATDEDLDLGDDAPADELEEIEYEGKTHRVPKELREAFLRQADYTRKTQEVAEQRRALEVQQMQFQQTAQMTAQFQQEYAQLASVQQQLARYEGVDWTRMSEDDPVTAQRLFFEYTRLKDGASQMQSQLQQRQQALVEQHRAAHEKLVEEGRQALARDIKGWSPELGEELVKYATSQGVSETEVRSTVSPAHLKILHKARLYDQMMAKASAKAKPSQQTPQEPVPTVTGRATSTPDPKRMSTEQWMRWRSKQLAMRT